MLTLLRTWFQYSMFGLAVGWWRLRHDAVDRAFLMVRQGVFYDLELAHRIYSGKLGNIFAYGSKGLAYEFHDNMARKELTATQRYGFEVYDDDRILYSVEGELLTCPVQGTGKPMDIEALSNFNRGSFAKQCSESFMMPQSAFGWSTLKWILVIGGIAVILFLIYKFVLHGHLPGASVVPTPTPAPTSTPIYSWGLWLLQNM